MEEDKYTGRTLAIFTDPHGLYEPTLAILDDMTRRGITEIYSLGDNIGVGPNPSEVLRLLVEYNVRTIAGNSEDYITLGTEPFRSYFGIVKQTSNDWTREQLTEEQIGLLTLMPHSIDLLVGGKKIALCHFINDIRCDFDSHSTWSYQRTMSSSPERAHEQFLYTNSPEQQREIEERIARDGNSPFIRGYLSARREPLFNGQDISFYDAIVQGHVHFELYDRSSATDIYTIRAVGMAYGNDPRDKASYIILREKTNGLGYDYEKVLVPYDREHMLHTIESTNYPGQESISKFTDASKGK